MKKRTPNIDEHLARQLDRYCHLRGIPVDEFVNHVLSDAIEPYQEWVEAFDRMKARASRSRRRGEIR